MDTGQIMCILNKVKSFLGVFPSDRLPYSIHQQNCTVMINADPHTESDSHWLAIRFEPRSSSAYYFDSFGRPPYISTIQDFPKRNCTVREYNAVQLQAPTTTVCGHYCCLHITWTEATRRNPLSPYSTTALLTSRSPGYSNTNLAHCARSLAGDIAVPPCITGE